MVLVGPRNSSGIGNEVGINSWYAAIGNGSHHMTSSQIYNSGSLIRLETNTQVTGSLIVSAGITGSLEGTAATASYVLQAVSASFATTASNADLLDGVHLSTLATTGSNIFKGNQIITGSVSITGSSITLNGAPLIDFYTSIALATAL